MQTDIIRFLAVLYACELAWAHLTVCPNTTVAKIGDQTYLNCSTNLASNSIHWKHGSDFVYAGGSIQDNYKGRFETENASQGACNLIITEVKSEDAGEYSCQDDGGHGELHSVQLIVLDGDPVCTTPETTEFVGPNSCGLQPDLIQHSCRIKYYGSQLPMVTWKKSADENPISEGVNHTMNTSHVNYILTQNADISSNSRSYFCETTQSAISQYKCSNATVISIQYALSSNSVVKKTKGDEIKCSANSSVSCNYKWKKFEDGNELIVSSDCIFTPSDPGMYKCEAECPLGNKTCTITVITVEVSSTEESSTTWIVVVVVVVVIVLIGFAIFIILWHRQKLRNKRGEWRTYQNNGKDTKNITGEREEDPIVIDGDESPVNVLISQPSPETSTVTTQQSQVPPVPPQTSSNSITDVKNETQQGDIQEQQHPTFLQKISQRNQGKPIVGIAIIKDTLFILMKYAYRVEGGQQPGMKSGKKWESKTESHLEIYAIKDFSFVEEHIIPDAVSPWDLVSCQDNECIYISDSKTKDSKDREIIKYNPIAYSRKSWSTGEYFGNLSVSSELHIILSVFVKDKLIEYEADGNKIREIDLAIRHPHHALKLNDGNFMVCQGSKDDLKHSVCVVKQDGNVKTFGGKLGSTEAQMKEPTYLAVISEESVLVADSINNRVLLLNSSLEFKKEFLTMNNQLILPLKVYFSPSEDKVFVLNGVPKDHELLVFNLK